MADTNRRMVDDEDRDGAGVTRERLWEAVSAGLCALLTAGAGPVDGAGALPPSSVARAKAEAAAERWGSRLSGWLGARLTDGTAVDRTLVEALLDAESALLVFSGEGAARVDRARRRLGELALGTLAPASGLAGAGR